MLTETINLSEYILRPRDERIAHVDLETTCDCRQLKGGRQDNRPLFKRVCEMLNLVNDIGNRQLAGIYVCHLCDEKNCLNPLHCYIGTHTENILDIPAERRSEASRKAQASMTPEQITKAAKRSAATRKQQGTGSKPVKVTEIDTGVEMLFKSGDEAARYLSLPPSNLSCVCNGKRKRVGTYYAEFI